MLITVGEVIIIVRTADIHNDKSIIIMSIGKEFLYLFILCKVMEHAVLYE